MITWWSAAAACLCMVLACGCWRSTNSLAVQRLAVGFALATLLIQGLVAVQLWRDGWLYPVPSAAANLNYYQRVHGRLSAHEQSPSLLPEQSEVIAAVRRNLLQWTAMEIVDSSDVSLQRAALEAMAHYIDFDSVDAGVAAEYLARERKAIELRQISLDAEIGTTEQQRAEAAQRFAAVTKVDHDDAEGAAQKRQLASELTAIETQLQQLRRDLRRLKDRQQWRQQMVEAAAGVNAQYPWLRLPVVVSGGVLRGWVWWLAFCGCNVLALVATVGLVVQAVPRRWITFVLAVGLYGVLCWLVVR